MTSSDIFRNSINALKHHSVIPYVPNSHVAKSILLRRQPNKLKVINSQRNDTLPKFFQVDEYKALKAKQINKALDEAVPLRHPAILHEAMRYSLPGGKRLMSTLCIASYEMIGGSQSVAMSMACAIELLVTMAHISMIKAKKVSPDRLLRAMVEINSAVGSEGIAAGQIMDINSEGKEVSLSELNFIHRHKTGKFIEASIVSGVIIGGGNEEETERMRHFGKCVGMAYQLWNDIVDVIGSPEMREKTGRDMTRDKATYPKLVGVDGSKKHAKELIAEAKQELAYFDPSRAAPPDHLVNFIVSFGNNN
ncbi:hypothetical protein WN943_006374 [Citrus x changshan-huyou]